MSNLLYEEQSVADIASAIRAKDGDDTLMKVGDMATRVRSLGYGYSGVVSYSDAYTQPATDVGKLVLLTGEDFTLTMPNVASLQPGVALTYYNDGNGPVTLSGTFENGDTSFAVQKGMSISVVWSGNSWAVIDTQVSAAALETEPLHRTINLAAGLAQFIGSNQSEPVTDSKTPTEIAALLSSALSSKLFPVATYEYAIFKNGLVLQWGIVTRQINNANIASGIIALPFAVTAMCCVATQLQSGTGYPWGITCTHAGTQIKYTALYSNAAQNITTNLGFQWLAVGLV